jgi:CBS-domain-containing membrane protein
MPHKEKKPSRRISPEKARKILHDKEIRGKPLTEKQRKLFGAAASRGKKK